MEPPVSIGEEVEVEIIGIGRKGDGIARKDGYVIIVPRGERCHKYKVEITQVFEKFGFGLVLEEIN